MPACPLLFLLPPNFLPISASTASMLFPIKSTAQPADTLKENGQNQPPNSLKIRRLAFPLQILSAQIARNATIPGLSPLRKGCGERRRHRTKQLEHMCRVHTSVAAKFKCEQVLHSDFLHLYALSSSPTAGKKSTSPFPVRTYFSYGQGGTSLKLQELILGCAHRNCCCLC